ncbi:hypothetical protein OG598_08010 [Micromonospora sp. NBC_00330]|uniref:hypothetical protein n=1 Tax=Micromonospora sp. NBC_00330 TaxID=2903585 RepID=UPI002E2CD162|nr:hypothetical protein [Micromonospora sp. NBC_00330]
MLSNEQIIGQALGRIEAGYVFPEKVADIDAAIRRRLAAGEYDNLEGPALCETVGETTRGGAHPTARHPVTEHILVTVPTARTTNSVTTRSPRVRAGWRHMCHS